MNPDGARTRPGKSVVAAAAAVVVLVFAALAVLWMSDDEPPTSGGNPDVAATPEAPDAAPTTATSDASPTADATTGATGDPPRADATTAASGGAGKSEPSPCPASGGRKARTGGMPFRADVDGDGQPDEVFIGAGEVGVRTGSGVVSSFDVATAKPLTVLGAADANGDGRDELFIQTSTVDGEQMSTGVVLGVFVDCELRPLLNKDSDPYVFLVGESHSADDPPIRRGVGCVTHEGKRHLVGLEGREGGHTVTWSRTIVEIDGNRARNGEVQRGTFERQGPDQEAIELLGKASCGENTFDNPLGS